MNTSADIGLELRTVVAAHGWDKAPREDPSTPAEYLNLLTALFDVGRRDLPLGRLFEGHLDAVQIIRRHGSPSQADKLRKELACGATVGMWNAALPGEPLCLDGDRLTGAKAYASGAGVLSHALITADTPHGAQLVLLDLHHHAPAIDRDWWRTVGMQRSETHIVRWVDAKIDDENRIGPANAYAGEPYFSGGALRFVAVHAGGVAGIFDKVRDHLVATGRAAGPFQAARLAELFSLTSVATGVTRRAAELWFVDEDEARQARVAAARLAVLDAAERAIMLAQQSVGLAGMFLEHPLSRHLADLTVYLRQPALDAQRVHVGHAAASGILVPAL